MKFNYKFAVVMRKDLQMSTAKFGVQVGHAVAGCCMKARETAIEEYIKEIESFGENFRLFPSGIRHIKGKDTKWFDEGQVKVVLQVPTEEELHQIAAKCILQEVPYYEVRDFGLTELDPNTFTCVGIGPDLTDRVNRITGNLKLWK